MGVNGGGEKLLGINGRGVEVGTNIGWFRGRVESWCIDW